MRHEQTFCDGCHAEVTDWKAQHRIAIEQWGGPIPPERFVACEDCANLVKLILSAADRRSFNSLDLPSQHALPPHVRVPE